MIKNCKKLMCGVMAGFCMLSSQSLVESKLFATSGESGGNEESSKFFSIGISEENRIKKAIDDIDITQENIDILDKYYSSMMSGFVYRGDEKYLENLEWETFQPEYVNYIKGVTDKIIVLAEESYKITKDDKMNGYLENAKHYRTIAYEQKSIKSTLQKLGCAIRLASFVSAKGVVFQIKHSEYMAPYYEKSKFDAAMNAYEKVISNNSNSILAYNAAKSANIEMGEQLSGDIAGVVALEYYLNNLSNRKSREAHLAYWAFRYVKEDKGLYLHITDKNIVRYANIIDSYNIFDIFKDAEEEEYSNIYIDRMRDNLYYMFNLKNNFNNMNKFEKEYGYITGDYQSVTDDDFDDDTDDSGDDVFNDFMLDDATQLAIREISI